MKWLIDILVALVTAVIKGLKKTPEEKQAEQALADKIKWQKEYDDAKTAYDDAENRWRTAVVTGAVSHEQLHARMVEAANKLGDCYRAGQRAGYVD